MSGRKWTEEELNIVREMYPNLFAWEIAKIIDRTPSQIQNKAFSLGVKASDEKIRRSGVIGANSPKAIAHQFKKGQTSVNKGKKMSAEMYAKCSRTMFKKGNVSANWKPKGTERMTEDGYIEVKIADKGLRMWRLKHRLVWEEANGKIPDGYNICFKNGDKTDCRLENLEIKSKEENMLDNSIHNYPKELVDVMRLQGQLKRQIRKREKNGK